ncbi:hypothetical protein D3C72_1669820 [compost metagenome]
MHIQVRIRFRDRLRQLVAQGQPAASARKLRGIQRVAEWLVMRGRRMRTQVGRPACAQLDLYLEPVRHARGQHDAAPVRAGVLARGPLLDRQHGAQALRILMQAMQLCGVDIAIAFDAACLPVRQRHRLEMGGPQCPVAIGQRQAETLRAMRSAEPRHHQQMPPQHAMGQPAQPDPWPVG